MQVQRTFALHFGRVCGQYRYDAGFAQVVLDALTADATRLQGRQGLLQAALDTSVIGQHSVAMAPVLVTVFGNIRELQEITEGATHR